MANKRGQLNCSTNRKNVGYGDCVLDWTQIVGGFMYDGPRTFTDEEVAALQATLIADAAADSKSNRCYPIHGFVAVTDGSEKVIIETYDYGRKAIVRDGDLDWTFQYRDGANCLNKSLRTHNGKRYWLFYDAENKIMGWNKSTGFSTIPTQFTYTHPFGLATGSKAATYLIQVVLLAKYVNEESDFVKADFDPTEVEGLQDIDILVNSWDQDTGVVNATLQIACGAENIYDLFSGNLVTASLTAYDQDGNVITVNTVAPVAGNKTFDITLDPADLPDSGTVTLTGAAVSVLDDQNIKGYEIGSVDLEVVGS